MRFESTVVLCSKPGSSDNDFARAILSEKRPETSLCGILLCMQVTLAHVSTKTRTHDACEGLVEEYLKRCTGFMGCGAEGFRNEERLLEWLSKLKARTEPAVMMLDGRGRQMTSEALAGWLGKQRDDGTQHVIFAVGPADGWSEAVRAGGLKRGGLLSLGPMTLAHTLARLVMAEQIYRAFTILTGHPYHRG